MSQTNFLIGRGELLTYDIKGPKRGGEKTEVYSFQIAKTRLKPQLTLAASELDSLPVDACPRDFGVARLTLNPGYIAKSYFPIAFLRTVGLESIGSRTVRITPDKWTKKGDPKECTTTELFVAGKRNVFRYLSDWLDVVEENSGVALDLAHIEKFSTFAAKDRVKIFDSSNEQFFEIGLHLLPDENSVFIRRAFQEYAKKFDVKLHADLSFQAGNMWFIPVEANRKNVGELASFVFVRVIRPVPTLRGMRPVPRSSSVSLSCNLPTEQPLSSDPRVAILDGGLPNDHPVGPWLRSYRLLDPNAHDHPDGTDHGLGVTSAFLFGPIQPNQTAQRPYAYVDHLRVLDSDTAVEDPLELYRTLGFVEQVLLSRQYEFINLSLGPNLPIEDTEIHAWTSVIDDLLSDGDTFMTVAIGNNGQLDKESGNSRVQVPSDCVNAIAVGAANSTETNWTRAPYSAIGPGRSPGVVKPDLMAFGGDSSSYFHVLTANKKPFLSPQLGTSFASPYLLRSAVGVRSILGKELSALAIKALLVHAADVSSHDIVDVGWGKIPEDMAAIITCQPGVARIVYQGELKPGKYLRATLPLPTGGLTGMVSLKATFCYASPTDPQDAAAYTKAGLDVVFRPNSGNIKDGKANAETKGFFDLKKFATEEERRSDMGKWETVLHGNLRMRGSSLNNPAFDIHYNAREGGGTARGAEKNRYALVITVEAQKHADLYNDILRAYASILTPIQPQVSLPIRL